MRPRKYALPLLLAALLATAGCSGLLGSPPSDPTAEAIGHRAAAEAQSVEHYTYTGDISVYARNGDRDRRISGRSNGSVNVSRREAVNVVRVEGETQRSYVTAEHALVPCRRPADVEYERQALPEGRAWVNGTVLASVTDPSVAARYTFVENTTYAGDPSSVIVLHPDLDALSERSRVFGGAGTTDYSDADNVTVRLTVDRETFRVERARLTAVAEDGGTTATATITFEFAYEPVGPLDIPDGGAVTDDSLWCGE